MLLHQPDFLPVKTFSFNIMMVTVVTVITNNSIALTNLPRPVLSTLYQLFHLLLTSTPRRIHLNAGTPQHSGLQGVVGQAVHCTKF